ncbi:MAG: hypothetical protein JO093_09705 [Acidobacteria bacterium]|nr:hypothetical protein [Acidobacteriota bacterium]MBV9185889.1 hypothetical protein [Acidobacteriota bacterium]
MHRFLCTSKGDATYGCKVREESAGQSREGDARTEKGHAEKRKLGQEGNEPQTGHRHRPLRSAPRRRQGAVEEVLSEEIFIQEIVVKEVVFEEIELEEIVFEKILEEEIAEPICVDLRKSADEN